MHIYNKLQQYHVSSYRMVIGIGLQYRRFHLVDLAPLFWSKLDCETRQLDFETRQTDFETEIVKLRSQILKLNKRIVKLNTQIVKPVL